jgi:hypothetical protein
MGGILLPITTAKRLERQTKGYFWHFRQSPKRSASPFFNWAGALF